MKRFIEENFGGSSIYHFTNHKMTLVTSVMYVLVDYAEYC
jgi:hypothetical protein